MTGLHKRELGILLGGDIAIFLGSLWLSLAIRSLASPTETAFYTHLAPFSMLFVVWAAVFFIAGLYDKQTVFVKKHLPGMIFRAQTINVIIAALFFFTFSVYGITPKTVLLIYLIVSSGIILLWRLFFFHMLFGRRKANALLLKSAPEADELEHEIMHNSKYDLRFAAVVPMDALAENGDAKRTLLSVIQRERISVVIADLRDPRMEPLLPTLFSLAFHGARVAVVDLVRIYESIFDRIPVSLLRYEWFLKNITRPSRSLGSVIKRGIDIGGALMLGAALFAVLPVIYIAIRMESAGPLFIRQTRIGKNNVPMTVYKIRTMHENESASNAWVGESKNRVTKVGRYLRELSIDEWPQAWNILKGEMSLIGPRNDIAGLAERLENEIPYYAIRTVMTPGLTGWAQTHQRYAPGKISPQSVEETKVRLAYDLYYLKHRSLLLDLNIALRTVKTLLSRVGNKAHSLVR